MRIMHVVGARPNFMKVAPVMRTFASYDHVSQVLVHTGQHYDTNMSEVFFRQLDIPEPDINLGVGSASHTVQTATIMLRLEDVLTHHYPDLILVYGDVNSTVAAALVCSKLLIPLGHVEAGLRSGDRTMPEEINRLITDQLANMLFTPSLDGNENLLREGVEKARIHFVGNVMIDTLVRLLPKAKASTQADWPSRFVLVTLHRPSNVDDPIVLKRILEALNTVSQRIPVLFPIHPRTRQRLQDIGLSFLNSPSLRFMEPVGYIEFLALQRAATIVVTDSGGIQEETTFLGVPCLTVRNSTERPVTISLGTNILVGTDPDRLLAEINNILEGNAKSGVVPDLWDGKASQRIADIVVSG